MQSMIGVITDRKEGSKPAFVLLFKGDVNLLTTTFVIANACQNNSTLINVDELEFSFCKRSFFSSRLQVFSPSPQSNTS